MSRQQIKKNNLIQIAIALAIVLLINFIGSYYFTRLDLTAEKRYTLAPSTKRLLAKLDDVVFVNIYLSGDELPVKFKRFKRATAEMLDELGVYSGGNVQYRFINPFDETDPKNRTAVITQLQQKGLQPTSVEEKTKEGKASRLVVFPGATMHYRGREIAVNFLKNNTTASHDINLNNSEQSLEFELINGIQKLMRKAPPRIAFIQGHGELPEIFIRDFAYSLAEYYYVEQAYIGGETDSLSKYEVLIMAKPQTAVSESDKFAIDQYIMQGGKLIWLVDGVNVDMDSIYSGATMALMNSVGIEDQLFRYGVRINPNIVQDLYAASIGVNVAPPGEEAQIKPLPWFYFPQISTPNNHPINKYLNVVMTPFVSSIDTVGSNPAVHKTILLSTSHLSKVTGVNIPQIIELAFAQPDEREYKDGRQAIAVLLEGNFESVFKGRNSNPLVKKRGAKFKAESQDTKMIVVSNGDIACNEVTANGEVQPLGFNRFTRQTYRGNKEFLINAVNYLCDENGLMNTRSREIKLRLLDKETVNNRSAFWQIVNTILPAIFIIVFGAAAFFVRRKQYTGKW